MTAPEHLTDEAFVRDIFRRAPVVLEDVESMREELDQDMLIYGMIEDDTIINRLLLIIEKLKTRLNIAERHLYLLRTVAIWDGIRI